MSQQGRAIELVTKDKAEPRVTVPEAPVSTSTWLFVTIVVLALIGNATLVWWRLVKTDPVDLAFNRAARRARLNRRERLKVRELTPDGVESVALLISPSALERAAGRVPGQNDVVASVRRKLERVSAEEAESRQAAASRN